MNAGISVSRVGGAAQTKLISKLGGGVRLALAQYRELAAFSQFASDLDEVTRRQLARGQRVMELMKQAQYRPYTIAEMALILYAIEYEYVDDLPIEEVRPFAQGLIASANATDQELLKNINSKGAYNDDVLSALGKVVGQFKKGGSWKVA